MDQTRNLSIWSKFYNLIRTIENHKLRKLNIQLIKCLRNFNCSAILCTPELWRGGQATIEPCWDRFGGQSNSQPAHKCQIVRLCLEAGDNSFRWSGSQFSGASPRSAQWCLDHTIELEKRSSPLFWYPGSSWSNRRCAPCSCLEARESFLVWVSK